MNLLTRETEPELMTDLRHVNGFSDADREQSVDAFIYLYRVLCSSSNQKIIDLGCGPGKYLIRFAQEFPNTTIIGYDGSVEMIELANHNIKNAGLEHRIIVKHSLFEDIPITDCDCIISSGTLHHSHDPLSFWASVKRIAKPGTQLYIMDILRPLTEEKVSSIVDALANKENIYFKKDLYNSLKAAFTKKEIEEQLKQSNLSLKLIVTSHQEFGELIFLKGNINEN